MCLDDCVSKFGQKLTGSFTWGTFRKGVSVAPMCLGECLGTGSVGRGGWLSCGNEGKGEGAGGGGGFLEVTRLHGFTCFCSVFRFFVESPQIPRKWPKQLCAPKIPSFQIIQNS